MSVPLSPPDVTSRVVGALPPYVSNGVIGVRYPGLPHLPGTTMVNGFAGRKPGRRGRGVRSRAIRRSRPTSSWTASGPPTRPNGRGCAGSATTSRPVSCTRAGTFRVDGRYGDGRIPRVLPAIRACPGGVPRSRSEVDRPADVAIAAGIDPADVPGRATPTRSRRIKGRTKASTGACGGTRRATSRRSAWPTPRRSGATPAARRETATRDERGWFSTTYRFRARADRTYRLTHITASVPSLSHAQPDEQAGRLAASAAHRGFERLRDENRSIWTRALDGPDHDRRSGRSLAGHHGREHVLPAQLRPCVVAGEHVVVRPRVLAELPLLPRARHVGHRDVQPPAAAVARNRMRRARCWTTGIGTSEAARQNAALAWLARRHVPMGELPGPRRRGRRPGARPYTEDHVSFDIALAFASYVHATGDLDYARRVGWPVLRSVAEFVASRVDPVLGGASRSATPSGRASTTSRSPTTPSPTWRRRRSLRQASDDRARRIGECPPPPGARSPAAWSCRGTPVAARSSTMTERGWTSRRAASPRGRRACFRSAIGTVDGDRAGDLPVRRASSRRPIYVGAPMLSALLPVYAARAGEPVSPATSSNRASVTFINEPFLEPDESRALARTGLGRRRCSRTSAAT